MGQLGRKGQNLWNSTTFHKSFDQLNLALAQYSKLELFNVKSSLQPRKIREPYRNRAVKAFRFLIFKSMVLTLICLVGTRKWTRATSCRRKPMVCMVCFSQLCNFWWQCTEKKWLPFPAYRRVTQGGLGCTFQLSATFFVLPLFPARVRKKKKTFGNSL